MNTLTFTIEEGVGTLTLNRPDSLNALNPEMMEELGDLLSTIRRDPSVRSLVLTGAGGAFSAGGDVKAMADDARSPAERRAGMARAGRVCSELLALDRPIIGAADGVAYGAGFSLLLTCDIVLLSERARLCMVFHRIGLIPDMGAYYTLPRVVGPQRAKELILSAREIQADEAVRLGLAMETLPVSELLPRAQALAHSLAGASSTAVSISKKAIQASMTSDLATMLEIEAAGQALAATSPYALEAVRRFKAKEPAQFVWPK